MARKTYGTTWWGQNWLASLTHIDYANRIPRGKTYANTGKVFDVNISPEQGRITAKVRGNYHPYYKVTLKFEQVNKEAKESFLSDLVKNLTIVSKLTNRELDPSLLDLALKHNIKLFPSSWKDLGMTCSCPDFAVPCKHIAAVIYIVSEVIDSNPFYVFSLKGIDLLKELENRGFNLDEATCVETATFDSLSRSSIITIEDLCAQAQEFNMQLEPVIINRTVPLDWEPDFTQGSCYDVQAIVDVDAIAAQHEAKSALTSEESKDESKSAVAPEPASKGAPQPKLKRKNKTQESAPSGSDKEAAAKDETAETSTPESSVTPVQEATEQKTTVQEATEQEATPAVETKPKARRGRKPKAEKAENAPQAKEFVPLGAGVDKFCETVGKIIESDFELAKRKKKPGRKTKEALEQEQHQAYLRAKFGSLTVVQAFDSLNHNTDLDVFADGEDFAEVKLPQESKAAVQAKAQVAQSETPSKAKRGRRCKSKAE